MLSANRFRKVMFYLAFSLFVLWVIINPDIPLSPEDGLTIVLFVFLIHSWIEKKYLLKKLSVKYTKQSKIIKNIFMNCPDLIYHKDQSLVYQDCNIAMRKTLALEEDETISGKTDFDIFDKETAQRIRKYERLVLEKHQIVSYKVEKITKSGESRFFDCFISPLQEGDEIIGVLGICRDITNTEELKTRILIQNAQLKSIIDNLPFMIYLKDLEGKFITGNKILEETVDRKIHELVGLKPQDLHLGRFSEDIKKEDSTVINEKRTVMIERHAENKDGKLGWYRVFKSPILNEDKEVLGIIVVVKNIDEEKELEAQKETLVATLTHDLKTPTTAQTTAMKILLKESLGKLNEDQKEIVQQALNSNIYMSDMISTILATYKAESGENKYKKEEIDFIELVNSTCKEVSNLAMTKDQNIILKSEIENSKIIADELQIKRAIVNLISNAITYGFEKTDIEIILEEKDDTICCNVKNRGRYIEPGKLIEIFEKFKTSPGAKFNKASTSLGLYLSKQIINAHNGEIHAKSSEDGTCIFGFSIPKNGVPSSKINN